MKRILILFFCFCLLLPAVSGCGAAAPRENGKLRVIISKVQPGAIGEPEHAGEDVGNADITDEA